MNLATETSKPDMEEGLLAVISAETARVRPRFQRQFQPPPWTSFSPREVRIENASIQHGTHEKLDRQIADSFEAAKEQIFEDGRESEFSRALMRLVNEYSVDAVAGLANLIIEEKVNPEIAAEALRWLGQIDHPASYLLRRWLLERSLHCSSARVRDGATLGLAFLDDPHAITYLRQAIEQEQVPELRADMEQVLMQLESAERCHFS